MRDMQAKILDAIETAALDTDATLDVVRKGDYANTGHVYVQRGWSTLLDLSYAFQSGYCSLTLTGPNVRRGPIMWADDEVPADGNRYAVVASRDGLSFPALNYTDGQRIELLLDLVRKAVA